nr:immunoglobulin heavy chain junction region [Macaca mulatta]
CAKTHTGVILTRGYFDYW